MASAHWEPSVRSCGPGTRRRSRRVGDEESPGPALVTPQKPLGVPTPSWSEQVAPRQPPPAGLTQAWLPLLSPSQVCFKYFCRSCWHWKRHRWRACATTAP